MKNDMFDGYLLNSRGDFVPDLGFGVSRNVKLRDFTEMYWEDKDGVGKVYKKKLDLPKGHNPREKPSAENMTVITESWYKYDLYRGTCEYLLKSDGVTTNHVLTHHNFIGDKWDTTKRKQLKNTNILNGKVFYFDESGCMKDPDLVGPKGIEEIENYINNRDESANELILMDKLDLLNKQKMQELQKDPDDPDYRLS